MPNDFIFRNNGKKATYDTLSIPEFVVGYCSVIVANLPNIPDTRVAIDHICYMSDVMSDIEGGDWDHVRNSHRQVLHQVEQGQITWEDTAARDAFRAKTLQRAERAAGMGKTLKAQNTQVGGGVNAMPRGPPCTPYQNNPCVFTTHHQTNGQTWVHMCATCVRVTGQRNPHPDCECKRRFSHERANRQQGSFNKGNEA